MDSDHLQTFCDELHRWSPVRKCSSREDVVDVFNLSVEEDESYVADSLVVHNCTHFSRAKGGKPVKKKIRSLAWVVIRWAKTVHPRLIVLENVPEFAEWGPLTSDNRPCPLRKGKTFRAWMAQLRTLGYEIEYKILCAADYGAPTIRKRLFLIARCDGQPIVWPEPTHAHPKILTKMGRIFKSNLKPWRTAAECIDWSIPCPSIFERKKPLAEATLRRIAKGIMRYVVNASDPFIVPLTHQGSDRVHSIHEPIKTVTSAHRGEMSVVAPMVVPIDHRGSGDGVSKSLDVPISTVTTENRHALVTPYLTKYHGESAGSDIENPFPTVTANSFHKRPGGNPPIALVAPVVVKNNFGTKPCQGVTDPLHTVTTQGNKHALVSAFLAKHYGDSGQRPGSEMGEPLGTVTSVDHHSLVTAHIQRDFKSSVGHSLDDPSGTITAGGGGKAALVTSNLVKLRGTCKDGQPVGEPMPTVTAGGNHVAEVRAFLLKYYGTDQDPQLREPLHTVTTKDRFGLVTIHGIDYQIVDIGMRMLTPRELFRAQGFPDSYVIDRLPSEKKIGKSDQIRLCGNSVCPPVAAAIVQANYLRIDAEEEEVG
ncbi:C-5 cytosine-specific DNA methylase [Leptospirillum ferriphilum]|uniref:DNA (cytosine-5-)-methyltransferase n=1 Tax=Leptospirillum ferriphilum TaxID=178606 RepID=A0A094WDV2_9BACT|nr:C-5 cytosine-specific DNA methylase [Leptospirillum ferriphilum]